MRRLSIKKSIILTVLTLAVGLTAGHLHRIYREAESKLARTRACLKEQNIVKFEKVRLRPHPHNNLQIIQNTNETRDLVRFHDSYFAATGGGLLQLAPDGTKIRHLTVRDGLPDKEQKQKD